MFSVQLPRNSIFMQLSWFLVYIFSVKPRCANGKLRFPFFRRLHRHLTRYISGKLWNQHGLN